MPVPFGDPRDIAISALWFMIRLSGLWQSLLEPRSPGLRRFSTISGEFSCAKFAGLVERGVVHARARPTLRGILQI
jgi:hypothetical protein